MQIRQIDLFDEFYRPVDNGRHQIQPFHVDRAHRTNPVDVDGARHTAHQPIRMRVFAAVHRMDFDDVLLEVQSFQIMRDGH